MVDDADTQTDEAAGSGPPAHHAAADDAAGAPDAAAPALPALVRAAELQTRQVRALFDGPGSTVVKARVVDAIGQAEATLEAARRRAEAIVSEAADEAEAIRREAHEQGRVAGHAEVLDALRQLEQAEQALMDDAERELVELAFRLARRIVGRAIELDDAIVAEMVAGVLRHARGRRRVVVFVPPADVATLEQVLPELRQRLDGAAVHVEADADLSRGSCMVETEAGRIDGRLELQFEMLQQALTGGGR